MQSFSLYIKNGIGINFYSIVLPNIFCQAFFIIKLNLLKMFSEFFIISNPVIRIISPLSISSFWE